MPDPVATGVALPPREAIAYLRQKANVTSEHWTDLWQEAHTRAFTVAGATTAALVEDFRAEVAKALEQGTSLAEFRKGFDAIVQKHGWQHTGKPGWRAEIIYQTNLSMAYSAGRYRRMSDPDVVDAFPFWRYQHNYAAHPRPQHVAWDGLTLRHDDPWWGTHWPPNGWRCHCSVEPVSGRALAREKRGVDVAPAAETRPWRNPKTGELLDVPKGIDPGFGYNPGQSWLDGEAGGRVGRGEDAARRPQMKAEALPPDHPAQPPPPPEPVAADASTWLRRQIEERQPDGTARVVGNIPARALDALGLSAGPAAVPTSAAITLSSRTAQHLARDAKAGRGQALDLDDIAHLPRLLAHPRAVLRDKTSDALLIVLDAPRDETRLRKVVIKLGYSEKIDRERRQVNLIATAGRVFEGNLRDANVYESLTGAW